MIEVVLLNCRRSHDFHMNYPLTVRDPRCLVSIAANAKFLCPERLNLTNTATCVDATPVNVIYPEKPRKNFARLLVFLCVRHRVVCDTLRFNFARIALKSPATDTSCLGSMPGAIRIFIFVSFAFVDPRLKIIRM